MANRKSRRRRRKERPAIAGTLGAAIDEDHRYEQEILSTELGRRSSEIRMKACRISEQGDLLRAHALFMEAAALFDDEDLGAAAAAALYDLGESFKKVSSPHSIEDLHEAERLLRLTIASPARQRAKLRLARSHDALGQTLRRLAQIHMDREERSKQFDEALRNLERACELAERCDVVGFEDAAGYHSNRGLALQQMERLDDAIDAFRTSLRFIDRWGLLGMPAKPSLRPKCRLHLARALIERCRATDLEIAGQIAQSIVDEGQPSHSAVAHILAARALVAKGSRHHAAAEQHLAAVIPHDVPNEYDEAIIDLLVELGDTKRVAAAARDAVLRALYERKGAMADHVADRCAAKAQRFAVREAEAHIADARGIDAFLALENASGLRYFDAVKQHLWRPGSAVFRALRRRKVINDSLAVQLDDFAARQTFFEPGVLDDVIQQLERGPHDPHPTEDQRVVHERMMDALEHARQHPSPRASLRARSRELLTHGERLYRAMGAADPSFGREARALDADCSARTLTTLLEDDPGFVFLRLHLGRRLLAASVWLDEGRLQGACVSLAVPDRIGELLSLEDQASGRLPEVSGLLESLDLSEIFPASAQCRHVVVLPSSFAARIPWSAAGPAGETLLDRFDAITYLPVLMPLQGRQAPRPPRWGMTTFLPGLALRRPTKFHDAAFSTPLDGETILRDSRQTPVPSSTPLTGRTSSRSIPTVVTVNRTVALDSRMAELRRRT